MQPSMRTQVLLASLLISNGLSSQAQAHHSVAQFDLDKRTSYVGTVTKYEWQNPHVWIWLDIPGANGSSRPVGIECAAPVALRSSALRWDSVKVGQKLTVTVAPLRNGQDGGLLVGLVWPDGHQWVSPFTDILKNAATGKGTAP